VVDACRLGGPCAGSEVYGAHQLRPVKPHRGAAGSAAHECQARPRFQPIGVRLHLVEKSLAGGRVILVDEQQVGAGRMWIVRVQRGRLAMHSVEPAAVGAAEMSQFQPAVPGERRPALDRRYRSLNRAPLFGKPRLGETRHGIVVDVEVTQSPQDAVVRYGVPHQCQLVGRAGVVGPGVDGGVHACGERSAQLGEAGRILQRSHGASKLRHDPEILEPRLRVRAGFIGQQLDAPEFGDGQESVNPLQQATQRPRITSPRRIVNSPAIRHVVQFDQVQQCAELGVLRFMNQGLGQGVAVRRAGQRNGTEGIP